MQNKYIFVEFLFNSGWIPVVEIESFLLCNAFFKNVLEYFYLRVSTAMGKVLTYF